MKKAAQARGVPGYLERLLERGEDKGEFVLVEPEILTKVMREFGLEPAGAGTKLARALEPIVGAVDKIFGTNIKGCLGCASREDRLNQKSGS